ncbi:MAG: lysophospholipid acyltransferase family protein [Ignavibacteriales bacterium]
MLRTIIWFIYFWIYLIFIMPGLWRAEYLEKKGRIREHDDLVSKYVGKWARSLLRLAGAKVTVIGLENIPDTASVFVSNHQGNFDIPLMLGYVGKPKALISKIEVQKLPIIRSWMKHLNCMFIDRDDHRQAVKSISRSLELLKKGYSIIIFPEGTRSKCDKIGTFKNGSFKMALKAGVPIVPITISGSYKLMEANKNIIKPAQVKITIHKAVETSEFSKEDVSQLQERIRSIIDIQS